MWTVRWTSPCDQSFRVNSTRDLLQRLVAGTSPLVCADLKSVLTCATVVSFPVERAEWKTSLPRFCLHPLRSSQAFCSPLVIGQETTAVQTNQHKQNYLTVCFPTAFRRPGWKKIDPFNKTGTTTALSVCPHPNLKIIPSMFLSTHLNVSVFLSWRQMHWAFLQF